MTLTARIGSSVGAGFEQAAKKRVAQSNAKWGFFMEVRRGSGYRLMQKPEQIQRY